MAMAENGRERLAFRLIRRKASRKSAARRPGAPNQKGRAGPAFGFCGCAPQPQQYSGGGGMSPGTSTDPVTQV
jgi:hypothetical protein